MPVEFDEYKQAREAVESLPIDPGSNAYRILSFLAQHPELGFKPAEIGAETEVPRGSLNPTLSRLEEQGLVEHEPPYWSVGDDDRVAAVGATMLSMEAFEDRYAEDDFTGWADSDVDPRKSDSATDPIASIPQSEYRPPVRAVRDRLIDAIGDDAEMVLFGSVARGEADRASDLDFFVVVNDERMAAQRAAHAIEDDLSDERFDGDRYEPHIVVETRDSAVSHDRIQQVFTEGITLNEAEILKTIRQQVAANGT